MVWRWQRSQKKHVLGKGAICSASVLGRRSHKASCIWKEWRLCWSYKDVFHSVTEDENKTSEASIELEVKITKNKTANKPMWWEGEKSRGRRYQCWRTCFSSYRLTAWVCMIVIYWFLSVCLPVCLSQDERETKDQDQVKTSPFCYNPRAKGGSVQAVTDVRTHWEFIFSLLSYNVGQN